MESTATLTKASRASVIDDVIDLLTPVGGDNGGCQKYSFHKNQIIKYKLIF